MGNKSGKSNLRNAIIYLNISADLVGLDDDKFWSQIWCEEATSAAEIIKSISVQEIRMLRDGSSKNFATLTYKMVERLNIATGTLCNSQSQQMAVLNAIRILIRLIPCIFEDKTWVRFFLENYLHSNEDKEDGTGSRTKLWIPEEGSKEKNYTSYLPPGTQTKISSSDETDDELQDDLIESSDKVEPNIVISMMMSDTTQPIDKNQVEDVKRSTKKQLINILVLSICDLLFCPEFTVVPQANNQLYKMVDAPPEDLRSLPSCDYVWEPGVGFDLNTNSTTNYDKSRSELLRLLLVSFSSILYEKPVNSINYRNQWIEIFASTDNRHALPLFTSLLNTIFIYKPNNSKLLPFNPFPSFENSRQELVELSIQVLIATLDYEFDDEESPNQRRNLFIDFMSKIHRSEDLLFLVKGFVRLLNNRFEQGYLINSSRPIGFEQELLILFWRMCNLNNKIIHYMLKSKDILDMVVPILYHLNENFQDTTKTGLIHIGVFNLLILSGERNFGVLLNKPYSSNLLSNLPPFSGSHADLMIIVFHKLILYGQDLHQLFDFLLTILVNISPYLKSLSMLACKCLIQLFEIFSSPFVVFTEPTYHQLVVNLLEIFNNIIQYQFDGNANLVYIIINKRETFINLANLTHTTNGIEKVLNKLIKKRSQQRNLADKMLSSGNQEAGANTKLVGDKGEAVSADKPNQITQFPSRTKATVSSDLNPASPPLVSLVDTPDICHMTKSIHLIEGISSGVAPSDKSVQHQMEEVGKFPTFNLDDILDQTVQEPLSLVTPDLIGVTGDKNAILLEALLSDKDREPKPKQTQSTMPSQTSSRLDSLATSTTRCSKKWKPTPVWVKQWKQTLPLHTTMRMIEVLSGQIERIKSNNKKTGAQEEMGEIIRFLQNGTLVGLLPVPHPIQIRKYYTNNETTLWFRACTWGIIYVRNSCWSSTHIKLIKIE